MRVRKSDQAIQNDVQSELEWDARLDPSGITVSVHGGVVALTGAVSSWSKRLVAQDAAQRVPGVLDVVNDLEVQLVDSHLRDDNDIAKAVRNALRLHDNVPDARIRSIVAEGVVTLQGDVELVRERDDSERAVAHVTGVKKVVNELLVKLEYVVHDVQHAVEAALQLHAARASEHLAVEVKEGTVRLQGHVQSWAEKQLVLGAAKSIAGVKLVEDHVWIAGR